MASDPSRSVPILERIITRNVISVTPDTSLGDTIALLGRAEEKSPVLVREKGRSIKIITEKDLLQAIAANPNWSEIPIGNLPSRSIVPLTDTETALTAWTFLRENRLSCLPVVDGEGELLGIVTAENLLGAIDPVAFAEAIEERHRLEAETVLEQIAREYRSLYDNAPCGYHSLDGSGIVIEMNDTELQMLGYKREEVIGKPITDFLPQEGRQSFAENFPKLKKQGWINNIDHPIYRKDGEIIFQNLSATAVYDDGGHFLMTRSVVVDVTDRKRIEFALRDSEARLNDILKSALISISSFRIFADGDWEYEEWSAGSDLLFGYTPEELAADKNLWMSRVDPEDRDQYIYPLLEDFFAERDARVDYRFRHKDGSIRWFSSTYTSRKGEGDYWTVTAVITDISDRVRAETRLRQREEFVSGIYEEFVSGIYNGTNQAIFVIDVTEDGDFRYLDFNRLSEQYVGISNEDIQGTTPEEAFGTDAGGAFRQNYDRCLRAGTSISYEERIVLIDREFWTLTTLSPLHDERGKIYRIVGTAIDITDRVQAQARLQTQLERKQLIAEITGYIRQSLDVNEVLQRTVDRVRDLLAIDRVIILRFDPGWQGEVVMESAASSCLPILSITIFDPCFGERYGESYRQGRIVAIEDVRAADLDPCYLELLEHFEVRANLVVPILQGENLWGLLIVHHCTAPRSWQSDEIDLLRQIALQVGIALQQSELYQRTHHELIERQQIQSALQASEERFRSLSAAAPIAIFQTNADGHCLYANERWREMSGLSNGDSLGEGWLRAIHPDDRGDLLRTWEASRRGFREFLDDFRLLTPDGVIRWVTVRIAPLRSAGEEIIGYVGTAMDISDRVRAEQALRESEARFRAILENSPAVIYLIDPENKLLLANRRYAELLSTTVDALIGKSIYDTWPEEIADAFAENNRKVLETGQLLPIEEVAPHADGPHTYLTVKFPLLNEDGQVYAVCGISTDITEKKRLEEQFYRAQRLESLGTLASGIAHDLNNVLTPILVLAQALSLEFADGSESTRQLLGVIESSAKQGADLVKQILVFSRGGEGKRVTLSVIPALSEVLRLAKRTFPKTIESSIELTDRDLWPVSADPTQLQQVLMNLIVNARDAMPEGGTLTLIVNNISIDEGFARLHLDARPGSYVAIEVADTGMGISPQQIDRIFDPFFTTKTAERGTGLGLSTVLGIVKNHGGFVQVSSQVGQGSRFTVYLPAQSGTIEPSGKRGRRTQNP